MSTAATGASRQQGVPWCACPVNNYWNIFLGALVSCCLANLPYVLRTLVQALGAPIGRPTIRNGLPRSYKEGGSLLASWVACLLPAAATACMTMHVLHLHWLFLELTGA